PVIQISATAVQVSDRARGLTQGADAYLTDPSEPEELLAVVLAALRYSRARQRAERTAALLAALTGVALDINAAETFDGLARAARAAPARRASGAGRHGHRADPGGEPGPRGGHALPRGLADARPGQHAAMRRLRGRGPAEAGPPAGGDGGRPGRRARRRGAAGPATAGAAGRAGHRCAARLRRVARHRATPTAPPAAA